MAEEAIIKRLDAIEQYCLLAAKNVLTMEDLAMLTGLSKSHIYKLTCAKQIPHYKPNGKCVYFKRAEVEAWLLQNRVVTQQEAQQEAAALLVNNELRKEGRL